MFFSDSIIYVGTDSGGQQPKKEDESVSNYSADISSGSSFDYATPPDHTERLRSLYGTMTPNVGCSNENGSSGLNDGVQGHLPVDDEVKNDLNGNGSGNLANSMSNNNAIKDEQNESLMGATAIAYGLGSNNNNAIKDEQNEPLMGATAISYDLGSNNNNAIKNDPDIVERESFVKQLKF